MAELLPVPRALGEECEMIPLSALNHFLFCARRAALIHIEGIFTDNEHTLRGDIVHEHADLAGYEVVKGVTLWRALPVWSERLGLNGKCDIVEVHPSPKRLSQLLSGTSAGPLPRPLSNEAIQGFHARNAASKHSHSQPLSHSKGEGGRSPGEGDTLLPVEFKLGKRRQWENDDAQLCAQALCLEEMFQCAIPRGAIFHAHSKRRREVEFTAELRALTERAIGELHALMDSDAVPLAVFKPACEECSLFDICLPKATASDSRASGLARALFKTD